MHRPLWEKISFFAIPTLTTFCLGVWQTQRYFWKVNIIEERKESLSKNILKENQLTNFEDVKFQKVQLTGHFDNSKEVLIGIRQLQRANKNSPMSTTEVGMLKIF